MNVNPYPEIDWDLGTAYDFFISLQVLHNPEKFGLRPSWAAGVRSRLTSAERKILEQAQRVLRTPFHWIAGLPEPKDAATVLRALLAIPAERRLPELALYPRMDADLSNTLMMVYKQKSWSEDDQQKIKEAYRREKEDMLKRKDLEAMLAVWSSPLEFGEALLAALNSYYRVFFAEEEQYIAPALKHGLQSAQDLAAKLTFPHLLERLSQGVQINYRIEVRKLVLTPSYWSTPLIVFGKVSESASAIAFGVRPANASLVPGEVVPEGLLRLLKTLADPTRLRILRYLSQDELSPSELARRLRLRAPTVTHHLNALRSAGLVSLTLEAHKENNYRARLDAIDAAAPQIRAFLESEGETDADS